MCVVCALEARVLTIHRMTMLRNPRVGSGEHSRFKEHVLGWLASRPISQETDDGMTTVRIHKGGNDSMNLSPQADDCPSFPEAVEVTRLCGDHDQRIRVREFAFSGEELCFGIDDKFSSIDETAKRFF